MHDEPRRLAVAGQRVAVNLTGLAVAEVERGDVLTQPSAGLAAAYLIDAELHFPDREPEHGERVQVHHGTRETAARLAWLGGRFWQLRLERELVPARGDGVVIRQIAPPDTLGGGTVLDPRPRKHGPGREVLTRLERLSRGEPAEPPETSPPVEPDRVRTGSRVSEAEAEPAAELSASAQALERRLRDAGFEPPLDSELDAPDLAELRQAGRAVRVSRTLHYHPDALGELRRRVSELAERSGGSVTLAQLRDQLGTSRKFAQALLEHLDAEKVTVRRGDEHVLRRAPRQGAATHSDGTPL